MLVLSFEELARFAVALALGGFVGLERQYAAGPDGPDREMAGIRTFSLIGLFGALAAKISEITGPWFFLGAFLCLAALTLSRHALQAIRSPQGTTTELSELLVFLLGGLVWWDHLEAVPVGIAVAMVLSLKDDLHSLTRRMEGKELRAILKFAFVLFVILPVLPDHGYGPMGLFNPRELWVVVMIVSTIGLMGYVAMRLLGTERGVGVAGFFGGLASSTLVAMTFARRAAESPALSNAAAVAVVLASSTMFHRAAVEVFAVGQALGPEVGPALICLGFVGYGGAGVLWLRMRRAQTDVREDRSAEPMGIGNPFSLTEGLKFGAIYLIIKALVGVIGALLGDQALYVIAIVSGLADVDAIILSVSGMAQEGMDLAVARDAVLLATLSNTFTKFMLVVILGSRRMALLVGACFAPVLVVGVVALLT